MTLHHTMIADAPVADVADLLCSEHYCLTTQRNREDVIDASYQPLSETDDELRFDVRIQHYKRKKSGGIDRSGTERSTTHYRYDRGAAVLHWQHEGEQPRVDVHGTTTMVDLGGRTRIDRVVEIRIDIPVIGRGIARLVEKEFAKGFARMEREIRQMLIERG